MFCTHIINIGLKLLSAIKRVLFFFSMVLFAQPILFASAEGLQIEEIVVSSEYRANTNTPVTYQNIDI